MLSLSFQSELFCCYSTFFNSREYILDCFFVVDQTESTALSLTSIGVLMCLSCIVRLIFFFAWLRSICVSTIFHIFFLIVCWFIFVPFRAYSSSLKCILLMIFWVMQIQLQSHLSVIFLQCGVIGWVWIINALVWLRLTLARI